MMRSRSSAVLLGRARAVCGEVSRHKSSVHFPRYSWSSSISRQLSTAHKPESTANAAEHVGAAAPAPSMQEAWSWVPPRDAPLEGSSEDGTIPVIKKQLLSLEEIVLAVEKMGGENVVKIELVDKIDTITHTVIATGNSRRHLRKMADVIVAALKSRELRLAPGFTGAEGADDDDWLLVDCYDSAVHFMLADTRKALNLEDHLTSKDKPYVNFSKNEEEYDKEMDRLLDEHPIPENYNVQTDFSSSTDSAMKKKSKKKVDYDGQDISASVREKYS